MINKDLLKEARKNSIYLILTIAAGVGIGIVIILQARLISKIISGVFLENYLLEEIQHQVIALVIVIISRAILLVVRDITAGELSTRIMFSLRNELFSKVLRLGPVRFKQEKTGEISNVIFQGIEKLDVYFRDYLPQLMLAGIVPIFVLFFVFPLDWLTGLIFLLTAPLIPLFMILIGQQAEIETNRQWKLLGVLNGYFFDVIRGLETLKNFNQSKGKIEEIRVRSEQYAEITLRVLRIAFLSALVLEILATISTAVVAVQIGLRLIYGRMAFEDGLFLLILAPEFYFPLRQLGASFHAGREGVAASERIFSLFRQTQMDRDVSIDKRVDVHFSEIIEFRNVSFQYETKEQPSVMDLNFCIEKGQYVALVGRSGGGKSTVAGLLMGFILPKVGEIQIDGQTLTSEKIYSWRKNIAYVPQFPYLLNGTIEDNLRIAKMDASFAEIEQAVKWANADEFISLLPFQYDTVVGENGAKISRGQAQRLAIARAFLRKAPFLVVDEPTASLDPKNDLRVSTILREAMPWHTVVVIAHRLSTVINADQVFVFDEGKIIELGAHKELIELNGTYAKLVATAGGWK